MKQETSQWGKAVKKAVIDHDMTLKQLAEKIGYSNAAVSQVVNGRYSNSSYKVIAEKINEVLGTEGLPERTETPSDEWCQTVKVELVKQSMTVNELAKQLDVSRDRLPLVINGPEGKPGWKKVRCPECGTLCWQRPEDAGVVKASHLDGAVCTKCALRKAGDVV